MAADMAGVTPESAPRQPAFAAAAALVARARGGRKSAPGAGAAPAAAPSPAPAAPIDVSDGAAATRKAEIEGRGTASRPRGRGRVDGGHEAPRRATRRRATSGVAALTFLGPSLHKTGQSRHLLEERGEVLPQRRRDGLVRSPFPTSLSTAAERCAARRWPSTALSLMVSV